jgi:long-subunit fatty acid transport protein
MRRLLCMPAFLGAVMVAAPAMAQGYFAGTQGARAAGRAGAFTAKADDLSAVALNPAGLAKVGGTIIQVGNRFSHNSYSYKRDPTLDWGHSTSDSSGIEHAPLVSFATVRNQKPWQPLDPLIGVASNLGLRDWGFALAAYAPAGIGRQEFPIDGGQRYMFVGYDMQILNYTASAAWKYRDVFGIGATLQWISVPKFRYQLVINGDPLKKHASPVSSGADVSSTVTGASLFTLNAILGAWYRPAPFLEWGLSGQVVPTHIRIKGHLGAQPLGSKIVGSPIELMRNDEPADDVTVTLPLPMTIREGVRYRHLRDGREVFDVELDVAYEFWSRVQRFTVESNGMNAYLGSELVNIGRIDLQKHWRNTVTVALGGDYAVIPKGLTLRGGASYISPVADRSYASVDFVGGSQMVGALGASIFLRGFEVALAYEYRYMLPVTVSERDSQVFQTVPGSQCPAPYTNRDLCNSHYLDRPGPPVNAGTYRAHSNVASVDILYRF